MIIMNNISNFKENMHNLQNFHIFQTENTPSMKYGLDAIPYHSSQLLQQVPIDIRKATSPDFLKNCIKVWKCEGFPGRSCKIFIQNVEYI